MNKRLKKLFCLVLSLVMVMGLGLSVNAATSSSKREDTAVMMLECTARGSSVSYQAITVDGGTDAEGNTWPSTTVYDYYIMLGSGSKASVPVKATFASGYTLKIDGTSVSNTGSYTAKLDFSQGSKTFTLVGTDNQVFRTFTVAAGVEGADIPTVYVRVDVKNAVDWLKTNTNADTTAAVTAVTNAIKAHRYVVNDDGQMAGFVPVSGLQSGATAMDAFKAACTVLGLQPVESNGYVSGIGANGIVLSERATTNYSGWLYLDKAVGSNSFQMANYGASSYSLNGGEQFVWCFANGWSNDQFAYLNQ